MNKIMRKLRSRNGASMLLALVFLLFCTFVGGSVLVSATSNAYRVAHLSDQQDYLNERSAALLMSDELYVEEDKRLQLNVVESVKTYQPVTILESGGTENIAGEDAHTERVVTFQAPANISMTKLQQLMFESTVWRYLREAEDNGSRIDDVTLYNFPVDNKENFLYQYTGLGMMENVPPVEGSFSVTGTFTLEESNTTVTIGGGSDPFVATFTSAGGDELYDFMVDFGDYSHLKVSMNAFSGTSEAIELEQVVAVSTDISSSGYALLTTQSVQTVISWDEPYIEKGGA